MEEYKTGLSISGIGIVLAVLAIMQWPEGHREKAGRMVGVFI
jgi:hypothetical protein